MVQRGQCTSVAGCLTKVIQSTREPSENGDMTFFQAGEPTSARSLRLWPGVVTVVLQWPVQLKCSHRGQGLRKR
jgi:hypothetical protein